MNLHLFPLTLGMKFSEAAKFVIEFVMDSRLDLVIRQGHFFTQV